MTGSGDGSGAGNGTEGERALATAETSPSRPEHVEPVERAEQLGRWIGLSELVEDAVHHGARAVEHLHRQTAHRPLAILGAVPPVAPLARAVDVVQDGLIASVYATVRGVNAAAGALVRAALRAASR